MYNSDKSSCSRIIVTIGLVLGLVSSIIAIYVFITGYETIEQTLSAFTKVEELSEPIDNTKTTLPIISVPISTLPPTTPVSLLPFKSGKVTIKILGERTHPRISYSFINDSYASENIPADIAFDYCQTGIGSKIHCNVTASDAFTIGKVPLEQVTEIPIANFSRSNLCDTYCAIEIGETFVIIAYDGHPVKFRISNLTTNYNDWLFRKEISFTMDYVYQPNNRMDFISP